MASSTKSPKQKRKRVLPSVTVDTNRRPHYITYKSALAWMSRHQNVFQKALDLVKLYPTLNQLKCMDSFWNFVHQYIDSNNRESLYTNYGSRQERRRSKEDESELSQHARNVTEYTINGTIEGVPAIEITAGTPRVISPEDRVRITVVGFSPQESKWSDLILNLTSTFFVNCPVVSDLCDGVHVSDAIVFIVTNHLLDNTEYVKFLGQVSFRYIPIIFIREPGFQIPNCVSFSSSKFCDKVLQEEELKSTSYSSIKSSKASSTDMPSLGKSGFYSSGLERQCSLEKEENTASESDFSIGYTLLQQKMKEAILYTGSNADFCIHVLLNEIHEYHEKRLRTPSAESSSQFSFVLSNDGGSDVLSTTDRLSESWRRGSFNATSAESLSDLNVQSENALLPEFSLNSDKIFTQLDRKASIDSETVYILFPVNYRGESTGPPRYIKWPRRNSEDRLDDLEYSSVSSDLSADFRDIDLSKPIFLDDVTSDEEFNVTPK